MDLDPRKKKLALPRNANQLALAQQQPTLLRRQNSLSRLDSPDGFVVGMAPALAAAPAGDASDDEDGGGAGGAGGKAGGGGGGVGVGVGAEGPTKLLDDIRGMPKEEHVSHQSVAMSHDAA